MAIVQPPLMAASIRSRPECEPTSAHDNYTNASAIPRHVTFDDELNDGNALGRMYEPSVARIARSTPNELRTAAKRSQRLKEEGRYPRPGGTTMGRIMSSRRAKVITVDVLSTETYGYALGLVSTKDLAHVHCRRHRKGVAGWIGRHLRKTKSQEELEAAGTFMPRPYGTGRFSIGDGDLSVGNDWAGQAVDESRPQTSGSSSGSEIDGVKRQNSGDSNGTLKSLVRRLGLMH